MIQAMLKKFVVGACVVAVSMIAFGNTALAVDLVVYTAVEAEDLPKYAANFNEDHPDIKIKWVRDSTGIMTVMTAKLLAEKNNPQADLAWGMSGSSLLLFKSEGMLHPYKPKGLENLDPKFYDSDPVPSWVGMDAYVAAIAYNTVEA
jgi:iron(III) transport system substrate-binding protein